MRPGVWEPPTALSAAVDAIIRRIRRAKLFVVLRQPHHQRLTPAFQQELATAYTASPRGQPPVPPAQLARALVLDCLDTTAPPFRKGTLVACCTRLVASALDRRRLERTVERYAEHQGVPSSRQLRAALDSSPL